MNNMLKNIIAVDKKAQETVREALREKENVEKKLREAKSSIEKKTEEVTERKTEEIRQEAQAQADKEISMACERCLECTEKLERLYEENGDRWVKELTEKTIGE